MRNVVGLGFGIGGGGIASNPYNELSLWLLWEVCQWRAVVNGCAWWFHDGE